jgi:hypothetical protein
MYYNAHRSKDAKVLEPHDFTPWVNQEVTKVADTPEARVKDLIAVKDAIKAKLPAKRKR